MSKRTLTPTQVNAAKDVVEAIRKAIISEKKINDGITKANSLVRGFSDRKKTKALRVLIAIENFLYKEPSPDHRIYEKGLVLLYKEEGRNEEYANLIEQKGLKGGDVARAVEEFLKKEKLQEPTEQEVEKELRLKKAGVGEAARGQQIILMAEDIEQEDVTRALKGIAADIERLAQEDKKKLENAEYNRTFNELLSKKREEYDRRGGKREKNSINGDGDDNESVKSRGVKPYDTKLETPLGGPRNRSNSVSSVPDDVDDTQTLKRSVSVQTAIRDELSYEMKGLQQRFDSLSEQQRLQVEQINSQAAELRQLKDDLEKHKLDPEAHPNLLARGATLVGGAGVGFDYSDYFNGIEQRIAELAKTLGDAKIEDANLLEELKEIKKEMVRMAAIQEKVEEDLLAAKKLAEAAKNAAHQRALDAKNEAEAKELQAKNEADARFATLSADRKKEFEALRKQTADHQEAEKKAREEKEARELEEKARRDDRPWPLRISKDELNALGHYKNNLDEAGKAHTVKIPEISGRIRESDKTMELYESGLSVAIYDFGKRGLTYLGHDVDAAGNAAADRESMMTIARVIDPKGDGYSEDVYCVISSSPERGMSTTYISKNTFDDIALKSRKEYDNAALATAKLYELRKALKVLEAGREIANEAKGLKDNQDGETDGYSVDDDYDGYSVDDDYEFSVVDDKIEALRKVMGDAEISLDPASTKAEADRVKREAVLEILSDYQSGVRKVFAAVRTFDGSDEEWESQLEDNKNNLKDDSDDGHPDLHGIYQEKLLALGLLEGQIEEILGSDNLIIRLYSIGSGDLETFDNFGQDLQRSQEIVEDLYPTRSHALKRAAQYSLEIEFGDLTKFSYQDAAGNQKSFLTSEQGAALKRAMAESSNTKKCLEKLTIVEKDNARRIASTEFSRNAAREIEMANKDKLDFNEFEKEAATAQLVQHWKSNRFFTGSNALASKETDVKEFFEKAKMSDGPYPGPQVTRPNRRNDMATVVFNGVNRFDPKSEDGYEGDDIMYLHVRGTLAPKALYVKVQVATADNQEVKFYKDGKETTKIFQYGDLIIDESTVYTKDSLGNHNPQGVSSLGKADQSLCKNFKVKAMSVIDGERKTAILFEGVPITPQNGLAKAAQVQEVPVILLHQCTPLVSLVTKKTVNKKGKEISDSGIYVQDASDPSKPAVLTGPLMNDAKLVEELKKHGVFKAPSCEELKKKIKLPEPVVASPSLAETKLQDTTNLPPPPQNLRKGIVR